MSHYTIGTPGGRLTYALDLDELFGRMDPETRRMLIAVAAQSGQSILDKIEAYVRDGLTEAAEGNGDAALVFERRDGLLFVTAMPVP